jgi:hypothetical protein
LPQPAVEGVGEQQHVEDVAGLGVAPEPKQREHLLEQPHVGLAQRVDLLEVPPLPPQPAAELAAAQHHLVEVGRHRPGEGHRQQGEEHHHQTALQEGPAPAPALHGDAPMDRSGKV